MTGMPQSYNVSVAVANTLSYLTNNTPHPTIKHVFGTRNLTLGYEFNNGEFSNPTAGFNAPSVHMGDFPLSHNQTIESDFADTPYFPRANPDDPVFEPTKYEEYPDVLLHPGHIAQRTPTGYSVEIENPLKQGSRSHFVAEYPSHLFRYKSGPLDIMPEGMILPPPRLASAPMPREERIKTLATWILRDGQKQPDLLEYYRQQFDWM
jgi:hypothetical protein